MTLQQKAKTFLEMLKLLEDPSKDDPENMVSITEEDDAKETQPGLYQAIKLKNDEYLLMRYQVSNHQTNSSKKVTSDALIPEFLAGLKQSKPVSLELLWGPWTIAKCTSFD